MWLHHNPRASIWGDYEWHRMLPQFQDKIRYGSLLDPTKSKPEIKHDSHVQLNNSMIDKEQMTIVSIIPLGVNC